MADVSRREPDESAYADHLQRSKRVWDRWSSRYAMSERDFAPMREALLDELAIAAGDRVLDVGCGPGVNLAELHERVGPDGAVVAIDYSPAMVERARTRVREHGWGNVEVYRADATTSDLDGPYDAAVATLSLSVMPDIRRAIANVNRALAAGGALGVLDIRPFPAGLRRVGNPLLRTFLRWYANWNPDGDVERGIRDTFEEVTVLETHLLGTVYSLRARRAA